MYIYIDIYIYMYIYVHAHLHIYICPYIRRHIYIPACTLICIVRRWWKFEEFPIRSFRCCWCSVRSCRQLACSVRSCPCRIENLALATQRIWAPWGVRNSKSSSSLHLLLLLLLLLLLPAPPPPSPLLFSSPDSALGASGA